MPSRSRCPPARGPRPSGRLLVRRPPAAARALVRRSGAPERVVPRARRAPPRPLRAPVPPATRAGEKARPSAPRKALRAGGTGLRPPSFCLLNGLLRSRRTEARAQDGRTALLSELSPHGERPREENSRATLSYNSRRRSEQKLDATCRSRPPGLDRSHRMRGVLAHRKGEIADRFRVGGGAQGVGGGNPRLVRERGSRRTAKT